MSSNPAQHLPKHNFATRHSTPARSFIESLDLVRLLSSVDGGVALDKQRRVNAVREHTDCVRVSPATVNPMRIYIGTYSHGAADCLNASIPLRKYGFAEQYHSPNSGRRAVRLSVSDKRKPFASPDVGLEQRTQTCK